jgi:DNA topoisomerase-2
VVDDRDNADRSRTVSKSAIIDHVLNWAKFQADKEIKKTDGSKRTRLSGLPKLSDANNAGSKHAQQCTLILTEGDSAKTLAIAGLGVVGRDNFGVFPLRGKLLNVREAKHDQIMKNEEIQNIKKIMGLVHNKEYSSTSSLRYGRLMIMTDQVGLLTLMKLKLLTTLSFRITMARISRACSSTS